MIKVTRTTGAYAALVSVLSGTIVWFNFRPLGLFFFSGLVVFWCRQYANLRLQMTPLVEEKLRNACRRALELRTNKPGLFCAIISCFLILLAVIGHVVSGAYIVVALLVLSIVISTKYDIKIVTDRERASQLSAQLDQEVAEFLPEIDEANASLLKQVGEDADISAVYKTDSTISERTKTGNGEEDDDDDTYSDLMIPQSSIKELDEEQSSESSSDELLLGTNNGTINTTGTSVGGAADISTGEIRFKSSHFNANTSSDSDDSISRGLSFDDVPDSRGASSRKKQPQQQHHQYQQLEKYSQPAASDQLVANLAGNLLAGGVLNYLSSAMAGAAAMSQSHPAPSRGGANSNISSSNSRNRMTVSSGAGAAAGRRPYSMGQGDSTDEDGDSDFEMLNPDELNHL
ncbi:uncharacterized protein LOC129747635 [Uranotaenia lowii]|uniref:uncharacterized protein LOC129747635 n=1 Tax=Uranotaenia lowii TaxID=190385 RepID=UPI002478E042|nr:uncharacterized protein LOC129747635 [Uranotaenia lowii]XP_055597910.1 uncharacterized protein LOC129747635 [Uranotaenia lowii]